MNEFNLDFLKTTRSAVQTSELIDNIFSCNQLDVKIGNRKCRSKKLELAQRISKVDELLREIEKFKLENAELQQQLMDFKITAQQVQELYTKEKYLHATVKNKLEELQTEHTKIDEEFANMSMVNEQMKARLAEYDGRPINFDNLVIKYVKLMDKLQGDNILKYNYDKDLVEKLKEYCSSMKLKIKLPNSPKKSKPRTNKIKTQESFVQCNLLEDNFQNDHTSNKPKMRDKSTLCITPICDQATQYISTMITRQTNTDKIIQKHVQTMFPETPAIDDILKVFSKWSNIRSVSPLLESPRRISDNEILKKLSTTGTCTMLCNIRRKIDYLPLNNSANIKREIFTPSVSPTPTSYPIATINSFCSSMPGNIPSKSILDLFNTTTSPSLGQLSPNTFNELWQIFGKMLLSLLQTSNDGIANTNQTSVFTQQQFLNWLQELYLNSQSVLQSNTDDNVPASPLLFNNTSSTLPKNVVRPQPQKTSTGSTHMRADATDTTSIQSVDLPITGNNSMQIQMQMQNAAEMSSINICSSKSHQINHSNSSKQETKNTKRLKKKQKILDEIQEILPEINLNKKKFKALKRILKNTNHRKKTFACPKNINLNSINEQSVPVVILTNGNKSDDKIETAVDFLKTYAAAQEMKQDFFSESEKMFLKQITNKNISDISDGLQSDDLTSLTSSSHAQLLSNNSSNKRIKSKTFESKPNKYQSLFGNSDSEELEELSMENCEFKIKSVIKSNVTSINRLRECKLDENTENGNDNLSTLDDSKSCATPAVVWSVDQRTDLSNDQNATQQNVLEQIALSPILQNACDHNSRSETPVSDTDKSLNENNFKSLRNINDDQIPAHHIATSTYPTDFEKDFELTSSDDEDLSESYSNETHEPRPETEYGFKDDDMCKESVGSNDLILSADVILKSQSSHSPKENDNNSSHSIKYKKSNSEKYIESEYNRGSGQEHINLGKNQNLQSRRTNDNKSINSRETLEAEFVIECRGEIEPKEQKCIRGTTNKSDLNFITDSENNTSEQTKRELESIASSKSNEQKIHLFNNCKEILQLSPASNLNERENMLIANAGQLNEIQQPVPKWEEGNVLETKERKTLISSSVAVSDTTESKRCNAVVSNISGVKGLKLLNINDTLPKLKQIRTTHVEENIMNEKSANCGENLNTLNIHVDNYPKEIKSNTSTPIIGGDILKSTNTEDEIDSNDYSNEDELMIDEDIIEENTTNQLGTNSCNISAILPESAENCNETINSNNISLLLNSTLCNEIITDSMKPILDDLLNEEMVTPAITLETKAKRGRKRTSECLLEVQPCKRSQRIKAKQITLEDSITFTKSPIELGKYTKKNVINKNVQLKSSLNEDVEKEFPLSKTKCIQTNKEHQNNATLNIGFFRERDFEDMIKVNNSTTFTSTSTLISDLNEGSEMKNRNKPDETQENYIKRKEYEQVPLIVGRLEEREKTCNQITLKPLDNCIYSDSPLSPASTETPIEGIPDAYVFIPEERLAQFKPQNNLQTLFDVLINSYKNENQKKVLQSVHSKDFRRQKEILNQFDKELKSYCHNEMDLDLYCTSTHTINKLLSISSDYNLMQMAVITIAQNAEGTNMAEDDLPSIIQEMPPRHLPQCLQRLFAFLKNVVTSNNHFCTDLISKIELLLFNPKQLENMSLQATLHVTQLYLMACKVQECVHIGKHPARLFIAKCLYFYLHKSVLMIHEVLMWYPSVLPHREDKTYDRSDALISVIQQILMNTKYDMDKTKSDLRGKSLLSKLRYEYHFDPYKPSQEEVINVLVEKLKSSKFYNISLAFCLLCKRIGVSATQNIILNKHLLPLAKEYYSMALRTDEYDNRIEILLNIISLVVKPFPIETDTQKYFNEFSRFLNGFDRQIIQEAALCSILRLQRFNVECCYNLLRYFRPSYHLKTQTQAMLKTFLYRRPLVFWKNLSQNSLHFN